MKANCCLATLQVLFVALSFSIFAEGQTENALYSFAGSPDDGNYPLAGLVFDRSGKAYGTTSAGGAYGGGTVFRLTPPATSGGAWSETVLYNFTGGSDGAGPFSGVILDQTGSLYGVTVGGGSGSCFYQGVSGCGTVYKLSPPAESGGAWLESVLYTFTDGTDGANPVGNLVFGWSGALYGTALFGGEFNGGTVFELSPPSEGDIWKFTLLHAFGATGDGSVPVAGVVF